MIGNICGIFFLFPQRHFFSERVSKSHNHIQKKYTDTYCTFIETFEQKDTPINFIVISINCESVLYHLLPYILTKFRHVINKGLSRTCI